MVFAFLDAFGRCKKKAKAEMTFADDGARLPVSRYLDLDRCVLLGPDAVLIPAGRASREAGSFACSARTARNEWLVELYDEDEDPVRVLIAGDDEWSEWRTTERGRLARTR